MMELEEYQSALALVEPAPAESRAGRVVARILPYGEIIEFQGSRITFTADSVTVPAGVIPVTIDHGGGVVERIGRVVNTYSRPDGLYGELQLSDTTLGRDIRTLLIDGVLEDVSAGVTRDTGREYSRNGVSYRFGSLDHVSIVGRGAWGSVAAPSKVLAAFSQKEGSAMPEETPTAPPVSPAPTDQFATRDDFARLERTVAELAVPKVQIKDNPRPGNFRNLQEFMLTQKAALAGNSRARERMEVYSKEAAAKAKALGAELSEFALADDTTTTAVGLVPDYLSQEIIGLIDNFRPYVETLTMDPVGDHGMSVVYPKVVTKPDVGSQATEKTEVTTQAMDIDPFSVDLVTYAGASDVSMQLIERSQPSFVDRLFAELAGIYAQRTDAAAIAAAVAGAVAASNTAVVADLSTSASATYAAFAAGAAGIAADVKRPADTVYVGTTRFSELLALVDSEGRPLIVPEEQGPNNAQGVGSFATFRFRYGGFRVIVDPHAAATTCLISWSGATSYLELAPQQLRAVQVDLLGVNLGVWGLFAPVVKYPSGMWAITAA